MNDNTPRFLDFTPIRTKDLDKSMNKTASFFPSLLRTHLVDKICGFYVVKSLVNAAAAIPITSAPPQDILHERMFNYRLQNK